MAIAPVVEEFLFDFSFTVVLKRYFGRFLGVTFSALLFAPLRTHISLRLRHCSFWEVVSRLPMNGAVPFLSP